MLVWIELVGALAAAGFTEYNVRSARETINKSVEQHTQLKEAYVKLAKEHILLWQAFEHLAKMCDEDIKNLQNAVAEIKECNGQGATQSSDLLNQQLQKILEYKISVLSGLGPINATRGTDLDPNKLNRADTDKLNTEVLCLDKFWQKFISDSPFLTNLGQTPLQRLLMIKKLQIEQAMDTESPEEIARLVKKLEQDMQDTNNQWESFKKHIASKIKSEPKTDGDSSQTV